MEKNLKLVFSILLFTFLNTGYGSMINIIYLSQNKASALIVKNIFSEKYLIPVQLIKLKLAEKCRSFDERYFELCINEKGELTELSNPNIKNIKKSLKVFNPEVKYD